MNDVPVPPVAPVPPEGPAGVSLRNLLHIVYGLFAVGFITAGMGAIAAIIVVYLKRQDAAGTVYASHFDWIARTFWWSVLWSAISWVLIWVLIGWIGLFATLVWVLYRIIKGWLALAENRPIGI